MLTSPGVTNSASSKTRPGPVSADATMRRGEREQKHPLWHGFEKMLPFG